MASDNLAATNMRQATEHALTEMGHMADFFRLAVRSDDPEVIAEARECLHALCAGYTATKEAVYRIGIGYRQNGVIDSEVTPVDVES